MCPGRTAVYVQYKEVKQQTSENSIAFDISVAGAVTDKVNSIGNWELCLLHVLKIEVEQ